MARPKRKPIRRQQEAKIKNPQGMPGKKIILYVIGAFMFVYAILGLLGAWNKIFHHLSRH